MNSWLDILPSTERAKIRAKMRSPEEYEKLREKVKGPEQLREEMSFNEQMAEVKFALETEPKLKESLRDQIAEDMKEQGIESLLESSEDLGDEVKQALKQGNFEVGVDNNPATNQDQLALYPEGNIAEKIPVSFSMSEQYASSLSEDGEGKLVTIEVRVNENICGYLEILDTLSEASILQIALADKSVQKCMQGKTVIRHSYFPNEYLQIEV